MSVEQGPGLVIDIRDDQLIQMPADDFAHPVGGPAAAQLAHLRADLLHPVVTGPVPAESSCATAPRTFVAGVNL